MNEQEILNKFEQDFNSGATIVEGLETAFDNLPDGFLEKDKTGEILNRLRQLKDTSRDSAVVAVVEELIEDINSEDDKVKFEALNDAKKYLKYFGV